MAGGIGTDEAPVFERTFGALVVWSFPTLVTIQRGAVITIFGVRQQLGVRVRS
jgi:hypothetical protein